MYIVKYSNIKNRPPKKTVDKINITNLYKILSIYTGKIIKYKLYIPSNEENNKNNNSHKFILEKVLQEVINLIITYVVEAIFVAIDKLKNIDHKTKKTILTFQICMTINLSLYNKYIQLSHVMNKYLPILRNNTLYIQ